jgi:hypothetical protein
MKISQLAAKPQLVLITLDDEAIIEQFGEALEFYTYDRQPLDIFMQLANLKQENQGEMINITRTLILDENGKQVIQGEATLPTTVLVKAIAKIVELLGKS